MYLSKDTNKNEMNLKKKELKKKKEKTMKLRKSFRLASNKSIKKK